MSSSSRKLECLVRLEVPELKDRLEVSETRPSQGEVMNTGLADAPCDILRGFGML
jgi:hypothetical protein